MVLIVVFYYMGCKKILVFENGYYGGFIGFVKGVLLSILFFDFVLVGYDDIVYVC